MKNHPEISDSLIQELKAHVALRRVSKGIALLDSHAGLFTSLDPSQPNAAAFVGFVAQWIDIGYRGPELLEQLLARFPEKARARLPMTAYLQLRMAEGLLALLRDRPNDALPHFDLFLLMQAEVADPELVAIAQFWNARCHRKKGEYDEALRHSRASCDLALSLGHEKMAAVMRVLEGWLLFQKGYRRECARVLQQAEQSLCDTDDHITLGNIYSAHGRMVRRQGRYNEALDFFAKSIEHFQKRSPNHRNLARSLANIAYVQRLIALKISRQIDAETERRRKSPGAARSGGKSERSWKLHEQVRAEALANLERAEAIYRHHNHHHGIGSVHENRSLLYLDIGDLDHAAAQAAMAYAIGKREEDSILVARSRLLQCTIEHAKLEEEIESSVHSWEHAQAARAYAREAVEAAQHTQHQRLLARAYIWRGLTACNAFFNELEDAKHCCDAATSFLRTVDYDDLSEELHLLKQKLAPAGGIDPLLRAWSQGATGDKTFQQITEQFAELVIPRVWEKEGKKISRVAARLSISPKKVRRILSRTGRLKKNAGG